MTNQIHLLIVDTHRLFRELLVTVLQKHDRIILDEAGSIEEAFAKLQVTHFEIVLLDWESIPKAQCFVSELKGLFPSVKALILTSNTSEDFVLQCIEAGASGHVPKTYTLHQLVDMIISIAEGTIQCSPTLAYLSFSRLADLARLRQGELLAATSLTAREVEILRLIASGLGNKEIASLLCVSLHTVKNHVHNILEKLRAESRNQAVTRAVERGLLPRVDYPQLYSQ